MFAIPFLLLVGSLLALQAAANLQLSTAMGSPFGASALQLGIGTLLLLAIAALAGSLGVFDLLDQAEPWALIGGLGSAVYITAGILLFPRLGALVAVGLFVAGQMLASRATPARRRSGGRAGGGRVGEGSGHLLRRTADVRPEPSGVARMVVGRVGSGDDVQLA